jgi:hypothetical protein
MIRSILRHPRLFWSSYGPVLVPLAGAALIAVGLWLTPVRNQCTWIGVANHAISTVQFLVILWIASRLWMKKFDK